MPDEPIPDQIEEHIATTQPDAFAQPPGDQGIHGKIVIADPQDGKEKEATLRSHHAGASSEAPASSGIPSAVTQQGLRREAVVEQETPAAANRTIATTEDTAP